AVRTWPRPMRILISSPIGTPRACEKFWTVTPDSTTAGPVGAAGCWSVFGSRGARSRAWRASGRGRPAPVSITTRRLRPPAPWPRGRIGLFGRSAISSIVKAFQRRIDVDRSFERPRERPARGRPLEAAEPPAGVDPASGRSRCRFDEDAVPGDEPDELRFRSPPAAAGTRSDRNVPLCRSVVYAAEEDS